MKHIYKLEQVVTVEPIESHIIYVNAHPYVSRQEDINAITSTAPIIIDPRYVMEDMIPETPMRLQPPIGYKYVLCCGCECLCAECCIKCCGIMRRHCFYSFFIVLLVALVLVGSITNSRI
jgi:hypothetical protein